MHMHVFSGLHQKKKKKPFSKIDCHSYCMISFLCGHDTLVIELRHRKRMLNTFDTNLVELDVMAALPELQPTPSDLYTTPHTTTHFKLYIYFSNASTFFS